MKVCNQISWTKFLLKNLYKHICSFRKSLKSFIHHISVKENFRTSIDHHDKVVSIIEMGL